MLSYVNHITHVSPQLHILEINEQISIEQYPSAFTFLCESVPACVKQIGIPFDPVFLGKPKFYGF
jgi:hypothetical protein